MAVGLLVVAAAGGFFLRGYDWARTTGPPAFSIDSDPPGAEVFLAGEAVGETPYIATNDFLEKKTVEVRLRRAGYQTWTGTFQGGVNAKVVAHLRRR